MKSWHELITEEMRQQNECWGDVVSNTLSFDELVKKFHDGFGGSEGCPFTVWTKNRVYFPVVYDGSEWVGSVSRNPDGNPTKHMGGE